MWRKIKEIFKRKRKPKYEYSYQYKRDLLNKNHIEEIILTNFLEHNHVYIINDLFGKLNSYKHHKKFFCCLTYSCVDYDNIFLSLLKLHSDGNDFKFKYKLLKNFKTNELEYIFTFVKI